MRYFWFGIAGGLWPILGTFLWGALAKETPWTEPALGSGWGLVTAVAAILLGLAGAAGLSMVRIEERRWRNVAASAGTVLTLVTIVAVFTGSGLYYLPAGPLVVLGAAMTPTGRTQQPRIKVRWR